MSSLNRTLVLIILSIAALLLVVSFSAYQLTTYGSVRGIVGDIAAESSQSSYMHGQYQDMTAYFSDSTGDSFVYHFEGLPISVSKDQAGTMTEAQITSYVLDSYAANLYLVQFGNGFMGKVSSVIGSNGNSLYMYMTVIFFLVAAGCIGALYYMSGGLAPEDLKDAGKYVLIACAIGMVIFLLVPGIVKSLVWGSIPNSDNSREILQIVESRISGQLFLTDLIVLIIGALVFWQGRRTIDGGTSGVSPVVRDSGNHKVKPL
jgi:hypothetical protein